MKNSTLYLLFIIYTHLVFPSLELIISNSYSDSDITIIDITLDDWFLVKGFLSISTFLILCYRDIQDARTILFKVLKYLSFIINFVIFIWMILGCIVLYENTNGQAPIFMYFSLIIGLFP